MNGKDIIIYRGSTAIAGVRSDDMASGCELIEKSSPSNGAWRNFVRGRKEWSIRSSYLVTSGDDVDEMLNVGNTYTIKVASRNAYGTTVNKLQGSAILKECRITANSGNLVQGGFVFQGSGPLTAI